MAMQDTDNYVKLDRSPIRVRPRQPDRAALRGRAARSEPQPQVTPLPAGTDDAWLRLTKAGNSYTGEYSLDGATWLPVGETNVSRTRWRRPTSGCSRSALSRAATWSVRLLHPRRRGRGRVHCTDEATVTSLDGASLDKARWNAIPNEDATKYIVADGGLTATTVAATCATRRRTCSSRRRRPRRRRLGIETKLSGTIVDGYQQGGLSRGATAPTSSSSTRSPTSATPASTGSTCARRSTARSSSPSRTSTCRPARRTSGCG